MQCFITCIGSG
ncbi:hypothetical protein YPPY92_1891, partial [Yersinia pestis PY-92]